MIAPFVQSSMVCSRFCAKWLPTLFQRGDGRLRDQSVIARTNSSDTLCLEDYAFKLISKEWYRNCDRRYRWRYNTASTLTEKTIGLLAYISYPFLYIYISFFSSASPSPFLPTWTWRSLYRPRDAKAARATNHYSIRSVLRQTQSPSSLWGSQWTEMPRVGFQRFR